MKICFFTENTHKGGMDKFIYTLANNWPNKEDEITILCNSSHPGYEDIRNHLNSKYIIKPSNIKLSWELKNNIANYLPRSIIPVISFILKYVLFPYQIFKLYVYFKNSSFKKLFTINGGYPGGYSCRAAPIAWYLAKKNKSKMACLSAVKETFWYAAPFEYLLDKALYFSLNELIFPSQYVKDTQLLRASLKNISSTVIYNGIDKFPIEFRSSKDNKIIKFLMLATYEKIKGHSLLLESFKKVIDNFDCTNFELTIAGYGTNEQKRNIIDEIKSKNLNKFVNLLDFQENVLELYQATHAVIIPSIKYEALPLTAIEAMSLQIPIISSDTGGLKEIFSLNRDIGLISSTSSSSMSKNIYMFIQNPNKHKIYGQHGIDTFTKYFTSEVCAAKYYSSLINH